MIRNTPGIIKIRLAPPAPPKSASTHNIVTIIPGINANLYMNFPGILLKSHKTSHSQYTHPFYQSCLTVIDNGSMYLVKY